jgi:hypothetical protein
MRWGFQTHMAKKYVRTGSRRRDFGYLLVALGRGTINAEDAYE